MDWRELTHQLWTCNRFYNTLALRASIIFISNIFLIVVFVPVEVNTAWQICLEERQDTQEHLRGQLLIDVHVVLEIQFLLIAEHIGNQQRYFFLSLDSVDENLISTSFTRELAFLDWDL